MPGALPGDSRKNPRPCNRIKCVQIPPGTLLSNHSGSMQSAPGLLTTVSKRCNRLLTHLLTGL